MRAMCTSSAARFPTGARIGIPWLGGTCGHCAYSALFLLHQDRQADDALHLSGTAVLLGVVTQGLGASSNSAGALSASNRNLSHAPDAFEISSSPEDFLVGVKRMGDDVQKLGHFSLEG